MTTPNEASPGRSEAVAVIIAALIAIYGISQFLRSSVGVIASDLARELGLSATEIGLLSSAFFFSFAAAQIPVGIAIDRYGPKRTLVATATLAIAGAVLFAAAPAPWARILARILMGLGCSTFLMAPLTIYARRFPPERFALLVSLQMGFANLGTLAATAPLAAAAAAIGWRASFLSVAALTTLFLVLVVAIVPRDHAVGQARESWVEAIRGVARAVRVRSFWPVFFVHLTAYSSFATVVGLWAGPWLTDTYGVDLALRGTLILVGAVGQIVGLFAWGPSDRWFGSYRVPVLIGGGATVLLLGIAAWVPFGLTAAVVWLGLFGFATAFTPILTAHGKSLFPPELTGRGITLMNIGAIGGTFLSQAATGVLVDAVGRAPGGGYAPDAYRAVFAALALWLLVALLTYIRVADPHPSHARPA